MRFALIAIFSPFALAAIPQATCDAVAQEVVYEKTNGVTFYTAIHDRHNSFMWYKNCEMACVNWPTGLSTPGGLEQLKQCFRNCFTADAPKDFPCALTVPWTGATVPMTLVLNPLGTTPRNNRRRRR